MESCSCIHCTGDDFHREQMSQQFTGKDDYMENKPPSVYEKLQELHSLIDTPKEKALVDDILEAVNAVHNELLVTAMRVNLRSEVVDDLLELQERLY